MTFAVIEAVVGEFVGAGNGLGYVLMTANGRLDTATLFAAIGALVIIGLVLFAAVLGPRHIPQTGAERVVSYDARCTRYGGHSARRAN